MVIEQTSRQKMDSSFAVVFSEWAKRYHADPEAFDREFLDAAKGDDGKVKDYGESCSAYFIKLLDELAAGKPWQEIAKAGA
jgi:hypothetical protein